MKKPPENMIYKNYNIQVLEAQEKAIIKFRDYNNHFLFYLSFFAYKEVTQR